MSLFTVAHDENDVRILLCVREKRFTEADIRRRFELLYPGRKEFDVMAAVAKTVANGFLKREEERGEGGVATTIFFITPRGRGLITPKKKEEKK